MAKQQESTNLAKKVIEKIESEGHFMIVGPRKGKILADEVKKKKPNRILEIGTYVGYSAILMADAMHGKVKIISLEVDHSNARVASENVNKAGFENIIEVKVGDAKKLITKLNETFDLMFIDAAKEEYLEYLLKAEEKLKKGAVVVADNVKIFEREMRDYLEYVRQSEKYESTTYDVGSDALEVSIKR